MKLIAWLSRLLRKKPSTPAPAPAVEGFTILDTQRHIHTTERI